MVSYTLTQSYKVGDTVTLSSASQISAVSEWKWDNRTLNNFKDKDGTKHLPGSTWEITYPDANLSAIWTLNKLSLPVAFSTGSGHGEISVVWKNTEAPLAKSSAPKYGIETTRTDGTKNIYYNSMLSIYVTPDTGYSVKKVTFDDTEKTLKDGYFTTSYASATKKGLSVEFLEGSILTYSYDRGYVNTDDDVL